jgi:hypothetical protein
MFARNLLVEADNYWPLAGGNNCIIRQFNSKYNGINIGDDVMMRHCKDATSSDMPYATELLRVTNVAIGTLDTIIQGHSEHFHIGDITYAETKNYVRGFYPVFTDEDENPVDDSDQPYIAIYF